MSLRINSCKVVTHQQKHLYLEKSPGHIPNLSSIGVGLMVFQALNRCTISSLALYNLSYLMLFWELFKRSNLPSYPNSKLHIHITEFIIVLLLLWTSLLVNFYCFSYLAVSFMSFLNISNNIYELMKYIYL